MLEPIFGNGNVVVLDSQFCMLKGTAELKKHGVYASAMIKKQKCWPKYIKGEQIKEHVNNKLIRDCNSWNGSFDKLNFHVYAMKQPDYVMLFMSAYGTNLHSGKEILREWVDEVGTKQQQNSITLKSWSIISSIDTQSMITTMNDIPQSFSKLFGPQSIGSATSSCS